MFKAAALLSGGRMGSCPGRARPEGGIRRTILPDCDRLRQVGEGRLGSVGELGEELVRHTAFMTRIRVVQSAGGDDGPM